MESPQRLTVVYVRAGSAPYNQCRLILRVARAEGPLRGVVRSYRLRQVELDLVPRRLVFAARTDQMLEFYLGMTPEVTVASGTRPLAVPSTVLIGTQALGRVELFLSGSIRTFTIAFTPTGFNQLFRMSMTEFAGKGVEARGLLGRRVTELRERLGNSPDFETMVGHANEFLLPLGQKSASLQDGFLRSVRQIHLGKADRFASIEDLASASGLSYRQFERRFKSSVGVSAKRYIRVRRFESALDMKQSQETLSWGQIAAECGYYDQMHLVHEFKELGGEVPSALSLQVRDRIQFASE